MFRALVGRSQIYKTPYVFLFGRDGLRSLGTEALKLLAVLSLCLSQFFTMEEETGVQVLIETVGASVKVRRRKLWLAAAVAVVFAVIAFLPRVLVCVYHYGLPELSAPANSLSMFRSFPDWWTIGGVFFLAATLCLCLSVAALLVIFLLARKTKNAVITMLLSVGTLLLPIISFLCLT